MDIPKPCREDWAQMTPSEKGRCCRVCNKEVLDLSGKSPDKVFEILEQCDFKACGRIEASRLNVPRFPPGFTKRAAIIFSVSAGIISGACTSALAQTEGELNKPTQADSSSQLRQPSVRTSWKISGTIKDKETHEGIPFANVVIYSGDTMIKAVASDFDGNFEFNLSSEEFTKNEYDLKVSCIGYKETIIKNIPLDNRNFALGIAMNFEETMIVGIIVHEHNFDAPSRTTYRKDQIRKLPYR